MRKIHKKINLMATLGISLLCTISCLLGFYCNRPINNSDLVKAKNEVITELSKNYDKLLIENQKNQELVKATTEEIKRLTQELKNYKNDEIVSTVFTEKSNQIGLSTVSDYIKANEAFSSKAYCDSDGKYRNGYGTLAKIIKYKVGDKVKVRDCKGNNTTLTATEDNLYLPEASITTEEALKRKETHIIENVFPYLYGKTFRSQEEFIVATDVIYNRGINQSKSLFNTDGTINCKSLYNYMDHSKKAYQKVMQKRYAKNYALCIQS